MSSDDPQNVSADRDRREAVREKAQQVQAKQSRVRMLQRVLLGVGGAAVIAGVAVGVVWAVGTGESQPRLQPETASADGFTVTAVTGETLPGLLATGGAPATQSAPSALEATPVPTPTSPGTVDIRVYVDYLSPGARDFQLANASQLSKWVGQSAATLTYHPVAMLTSKSNGTKYSLRAANAAACVATKAPEAFFAYNHNLLEQQPSVDSDGLTDEQLADLAISSGASPSAVRDCIEREAYTAWVKDATDRALDGLADTDGVALTGTPMVLVNGTPYVGKLDDPKEFAQFVLTIASDAYYRTPTPTPTDSVGPEPAPAPAP